MMPFDGIKQQQVTMDMVIEKTSYSELVGNFKDKFGILWGFMVG